MRASNICLTLTGSTLEKNAADVLRYNSHIDMAELRVDCLTEEEQLYARRFPSMINVPCVLTIRRKSDGGEFTRGETSRTMLFGRALAFADRDQTKNFAYVDFEEDYHVPSLQDSALAFGVRIIRSLHVIDGPMTGLKARCDNMRKTGHEIPKIAFLPHTLNDIALLFKEAEDFHGEDEYDHILCTMGPMGQVVRILAPKLHSFVTYTSPEGSSVGASLGHITPEEMDSVYNFHSINDNTQVFGIAGWPLAKTMSPRLHNAGYYQHGINAVFVPIRSPNISDIMAFAKEAGVKGMAVTVPHKEGVLTELSETDESVLDIGSCNTVLRRNNGFVGYNTDASGFREALEGFLKEKKLHRRRVAIIGAGGAAKAIAYVIKQMGGKACVFNRTVEKARVLAQRYGFEYSALDISSASKLYDYSDIIVQTTSKGMDASDLPSKDNDPIYFYKFHGHENVFDIVYVPAITPIMARAQAAGCKTCNGEAMLRYQGERQFKIFTGIDYNSD